MIGKTVSHYKIIDKIGGGGMGVVYKAKDEKLDRIVALKFLPQHLLEDKEAEQRFMSEAKSASSLDHPNICTIYDINKTEDGQMFIALAYYDGETLKKKIKSGTLTAENAIDITTQIANGLKRAHQNGIIHRDIKPANIMITNHDEVKILDFGLAKSKGTNDLTKLGSTIGTAAYMSPEQARGENVDQRTDIWALGVILYEMITGKAPFKGEYEQAIIYSILNEEPQKSDGVDERIWNIITKAISKDTSSRYQTIDEMYSDLNEIRSGSASKTKITNYSTKPTEKSLKVKSKLVLSISAILVAVVFIIYFFVFNKPSETIETTGKKMIVVLPFQNLGSTDDEYFADGITGEITSKLSGLSGLGVIARSSAMQYKNTGKSLKQIGEELGVQYVLEGTVQWEQLPNGKKRIRVNPELIDINNTTQMWSKPYESDFSSAFTLQTEIASTVANALNLTLVKSEQISLEKKITSNSDAYDIYLKALYYSSDIGNEKNSRIAVEMLQNAISLDDNFAEAYALLSVVQTNLYWEYFEHTEEILRQAKANAEMSLQIDPDLPQTHVAMGAYYYHGILDYDNALREYNEAIKLNPDNVEANNGIAFVFRRQGKMHEAIKYFEKTFKLDPKNYNTVYSIGETNCLLRKYDQVVPYLDNAILISPDAVFAYDMKARSYLLSGGNIEAARKVIMNALNKKIGLDSKDFINTIYQFDVMDKNFVAALNQIKGVDEIDIQFSYKPEYLLTALVYMLMKNETLATKNFKSAVQVLKEKIKEHPDDSRLYTSLGICYAGLGQKEDAIKEGKHGYELLPISKEAWRGTFRLLDLAQIYTMVGEQELALDAIEDLLIRPTDAISPWLLKLDPTWEPLRGNPRYQKLTSNLTKAYNP